MAAGDFSNHWRAGELCGVALVRGGVSVYNKCHALFALLMVIMLSLATVAFAHSGRTDSSGGHKDNKNKSGLGYYHYHCDNHPAHLHESGFCPYAPKDKISVKNMPRKMGVGEMVTLDWDVTANSGDDSVDWDSSDASVVSVSSSGVLTAHKAGSALLTATMLNGVKTFSIKVTNLSIESISLSTASREVAVGTIVDIDSFIEPTNATNQSLDWVSDNEDVAIVLSDGLVMGIGAGKCGITAYACDAGKKSGSLTLTVGQDSTAEIDADAILSKLPLGFMIHGKYGSASNEFARQYGLPFEAILPTGLPFTMGDKGEAVKDVQVKLTKLGYSLGVADGSYGKKTDTALQSYYEAMQKTYDGEVSEGDYIEIMNH